MSFFEVNTNKYVNIKKSAKIDFGLGRSHENGLLCPYIFISKQDKQACATYTSYFPEISEDLINNGDLAKIFWNFVGQEVYFTRDDIIKMADQLKNKKN